MAFEKVKEIIKEPATFTSAIDLAAEKLGGKVLYATDDFFAEKENLIKASRGIFIAEKFTERGKWMDGWESRRKRTPGHDWAIIKLAASGKIIGFDIDTNFFLGNHPPHACIEAIYLNDDTAVNWENENLDWKEILPKSSLDAGSQNFYACNSTEIFTHVKLHIYPDGGVARLRVYGEIFKKWDLVASTETIDLAAAINGANAVACNDMFFSSMNNLLMPDRGVNMGDGWETKRNRTPNNRDWVIIKLATKGVIKNAIIDTAHFKGNYPDSCTIEACSTENNNEVITDKVTWTTIVPVTKLSADSIHEVEVTDTNIYTHVRLNIFPDGGVSRLRLFGNKA